MNHQLTFADSEFSHKCRQTRKEIFLRRMELVALSPNPISTLKETSRLLDFTLDRLHINT